MLVLLGSLRWHITSVDLVMWLVVVMVVHMMWCVCMIMTVVIAADWRRRISIRVSP